MGKYKKIHYIFFIGAIFLILLSFLGILWRNKPLDSQNNVTRLLRDAIVRIGVKERIYMPGGATIEHESFGRGFFLNQTNMLVTSAHIVGDIKSVQILFPHGEVREGRVIGKNISRDRASISVEYLRATNLSVSNLSPQIGQKLSTLSLSGALISGVVRQLNQSVRVQDKRGILHTLTGVIVLDIQFAEGMSGSPVVDESGEVVGMVSAHGSGGYIVEVK